jgi:hypothetical protein
MSFVRNIRPGVWVGSIAIIGGGIVLWSSLGLRVQRVSRSPAFAADVAAAEHVQRSRSAGLDRTPDTGEEPSSSALEARDLHEVR